MLMGRRPRITRQCESAPNGAPETVPMIPAPLRGATHFMRNPGALPSSWPVALRAMARKIVRRRRGLLERIAAHDRGEDVVAAQAEQDARA